MKTTMNKNDPTGHWSHDRESTVMVYESRFEPLDQASLFWIIIVLPFDDIWIAAETKKSQARQHLDTFTTPMTLRRRFSNDASQISNASLRVKDERPASVAMHRTEPTLGPELQVYAN